MIEVFLFSQKPYSEAWRGTLGQDSQPEWESPWTTENNRQRFILYMGQVKTNVSILLKFINTQPLT